VYYTYYPPPQKRLEVKNIIYIFVISFLAWIHPNPSYAIGMLMICPGGKVNIGDTSKNVVDKCGKESGLSRGTRPIGKLQISTRYSTKTIKFESGDVVKFIFIEDRLFLVLSD